MKLAIVGSRSLEGSEKARREVGLAILFLEPDEVVSGGAEGVDTMAREEADKQGIAFTEFLPTKKKWYGKGGFRERNKKIAEYCDALVCIRSSSSPTFGSGWTLKYAKELGKKTFERVLP